MIKMARVFLTALIWLSVAAWPFNATAQTRQKGADAEARGADSVRVEYVGYRPARYETEFLVEPDDERPNRGGLVYVYLRNVAAEPVELAFWRVNRKDESHWRLDGFLAWDRVYDPHLDPGELTVLEINAVTEDFGAGTPFEFSYVQRASWRPACRCETELREDAVQIALIRILPGLAELEVHVRHRGPDEVTLGDIAVEGRRVENLAWLGERMSDNAHAIARVTLEEPLQPADLAIVSVMVKNGKESRAVFAHRRAFEDRFPIGCWSNNENTFDEIRRLHIDTFVRGGRAEDTFFTETAARYGFRTMTHCGVPVDVDQVRSLGDHPAVACWMLADEPDWSTPANIMLLGDETVRRYNRTKPTFITLCRNVKFFEYAPICDIPCMDHYSVTAPTSSKWPKMYGTHLEETGYYTRDLKGCSEPKPIWVWSQGIAGWGERPKRPVPTPNELAVQLLQNLGQGAKGIIWFNYDHAIAEQYPDVREAMRGWGRVLSVTRNDFLGAEPIEAEVVAPDKTYALPLVSRDKVLICLTNGDYEIHPEAYPFTTKPAVELEVAVPEWIAPAVALEVGPEGVASLSFKAERGKVIVEAGDLEAAKLIVLANDATTEQTYRQAFASAQADETRTW
ncbi:MAG TPA: hypothetical protein PLO37_22590 [Candidatus Hydrogenedentes bacterium]|nr:hypothetical protein [Candidatus Hydrogenedentota bacterium]HPG69645.1 hypothetical protein [Candidatus Hydrogenedentota bacterium]